MKTLVEDGLRAALVAGVAGFVFQWVIGSMLLAYSVSEWWGLVAAVPLGIVVGYAYDHFRARP